MPTMIKKLANFDGPDGAAAVIIIMTYEGEHAAVCKSWFNYV